MVRSLPLVAVVFLLLLAPLAGADVGIFGTHVTSDAGAQIYDLDATELTSVVFIDDDGDGRPSPDEPILLLKSGTFIHTDAVRLAYPLEGQLGSRVGSSDAEQGHTGTSLDGQLAYLDQDSDGVFTPGDLLFYDLAAANQGTVSVGDLYLTGPSAGTLVSSGSDVISRGLTTISGTWAIDDKTNNGYDRDDPVFVDGDGDGRISVADVRVGPNTGSQFGTWVPVTVSRITLPLSTSNPPSTFVHIDGDQDSRTDPEEPVFLSRSSSQVLSGSVRLFSPMTGEVGSLVSSGDSDLGRSVTELSGTLSFDGTGSIGKDEPLIFDHDGSGSGTGDIRELILSGQEAGTLIDSSSPHEGASLSVAPGTISFLDVDGNGGFGIYDILYLDADDDGFVSSGDVQLSAYTEEVLHMSDPEAGGSTGGDEGDDGTEQDPEPEPEPDQNDTSDDEPTGPTDSDGDGVPDGQDACPSYAADTPDGCPVDADGDGVPDAEDACPDVAAVTEDGCPPDADGDGVFDRDDDCPDEVGATANAGCPEPASTDDGNATDDGQGEGQQGSPGPGALAVLAALSGMALALARRRST